MKIENSLISKPQVPTERVANIKQSRPTEVSVETEQYKQETNITKKEVEKKIDSVNKFLESSNTAIKFQFHEKLNEYYVSIVDSQTKEVVKEIPPRKFLDMYANILESIGLLVDHRI